MSTLDIAIIVFGVVMVVDNLASAYSFRDACDDERIKRLEKKIDELILKMDDKESEV